MRKIRVLLPDVERLRDVFSIDPTDGRLLMLIPTRHRLAGQEAGYQNNIGYRQVMFSGKIYSVHRIAWALYHGEHPISEVDHINGNRADNRLCNLRLATSSENNQNRRISSRNKSGVKGVFRVKWNKGSRWRAVVGHDGGKYHIAHFECFGRAIRHANQMRAALHSQFANDGHRAVGVA